MIGSRREGSSESRKSWVRGFFSLSNLSLMEKNQLMRFFKLVQGHVVAMVRVGTSSNDEEKGKMKISYEDLERSFNE